MILLNFGKKLDAISLEMFKQMAGQKIDEQLTMPIEASTTEEFLKAWKKASIKLNLTDADLCADRIVINPSGNQMHMFVLIALLYKKTGKMPIVMATRAPAFGLSARLEISEVIDLQKWIE